MPETEGLEVPKLVIEEAHKSYTITTIIALTAPDKYYHASGIAKWIAKPVNIESLNLILYELKLY